MAADQRTLNTSFLRWAVIASYGSERASPAEEPSSKQKFFITPRNNDSHWSKNNADSKIPVFVSHNLPMGSRCSETSRPGYRYQLHLGEPGSA